MPAAAAGAAALIELCNEPLNPPRVRTSPGSSMPPTPCGRVAFDACARAVLFVAQAETEIRVLMERLQRQASVSPFQGSSARERDPDSLLPRGSQKDKAVLDYIATAAQVSSHAAHAAHMPAGAVLFVGTPRRRAHVPPMGRARQLT